MNTDIAKVPTGILGLDEVLFGGFRRGTAVLVEGAPGTGKTTLGLQFIYEGAVHHDEPGVVITFEEFPKQMFRDAKNFGWDFQELVQAKKVQVICTSPHVLQSQLHSPEGIIHRMLHEINARRILVDSVTHFQRITNDPVQLRDVLNSFLNVLRQGEFTTLLTSEVRHADQEELSFEQYAVDAVVRLFFEPVNKVQRRRFMEVIKARGQDFVAGKHSFQIGDGGVRVFPAPRPGLWQKDGAKTKAATLRRVESGVPGLDRMLGGGLFEGFSVLVAGEAGCGKSTITRHFIAHGIKQGEPALYVALRESPEKIVSTCLTIGIDLQPMIDAGTLTILHYPPVDLDPYKLFWEINELVNKKGFKRAVVDSLTDIEPALIEPQAFRDYVYALVDLFSSHNITSFMTLNVLPTAAEREMIESDLAMVMDAIFAMRFKNVHDHLRKTISILKMRGTEHDTGIRTLRISAGEGMLIETGFEGVPSFLRKLQQLSAGGEQ